MLFSRPFLGQSVAVRTLNIKGGDARRDYKIVKVREVHPNGTIFLSEDGEENNTADIIRMF